MSAFQTLDWRRIDVQAIVDLGGLAAIDERRHSSCLSWLQREGYRIDSLDFRTGISTAVTNLASLLSWEEQFGYSLESSDRNLNRLRDGFRYLEASETDVGRVLELVRPDLAWQEDSWWLLGLLSIVQQHSRWELALGRRFFTLLVIPDDTCPLIGQVISEHQVSGLFWSPCFEIHEFIE